MNRRLITLTLIGLLTVTGAGAAAAIGPKPAIQQLEQATAQLADNLEHSIPGDCTHTVRTGPGNTIIGVVRCQISPGR
jgi:hypothetical protein